MNYSDNQSHILYSQYMCLFNTYNIAHDHFPYLFIYSFIIY